MLININRNLLGEVALNQIYTSLMELKWEGVIDKMHYTVHAIPACFQLLGYGFALKNYVKYIHNRPMPAHYNEIEKKKELLLRNRRLLFFALFGAPVMLASLKWVSPSLKDVATVSVSTSSTTISSPLSGDEVNNKINSLLPGFTVFSYLNKKIPSWVKLVIKLFLVFLLVIKLLGISFLEFYNSWLYLRMYCYFVSTLIIMYELLNLYLMHKFHTQTIKIPQVLPDFLRNWLKEFEAVSSRVEYIKEFKKGCYIEIGMYLSLIIIVTLIF